MRRPAPVAPQATASDVQQWLSQGLITDQEAKKWVEPLQLHMMQLHAPSPPPPPGGCRFKHADPLSPLCPCCSFSPQQLEFMARKRQGESGYVVSCWMLPPPPPVGLRHGPFESPQPHNSLHPSSTHRRLALPGTQRQQQPGERSRQPGALLLLHLLPPPLLPPVLSPPLVAAALVQHRPLLLLGLLLRAAFLLGQPCTGPLRRHQRPEGPQGAARVLCTSRIHRCTLHAAAT